MIPMYIDMYIDITMDEYEQMVKETNNTRLFVYHNGSPSNETIKAQRHNE